MPEPAPLVVFSDDWGRHPSSCQHLVRHLLPHRRVTWVNTIGTRPPRLDRATFSRGFEKVCSWARRSPSSASGSGLRVVDPFTWPSFRSRFARELNRRLLARAAGRGGATGPEPVVVTTLPLLADLVGRVRARRWVYYCVDDYSVWPGLDGRTLRAMEAELVPKVDIAVAASEALRTHLAKLGKPARVLTHGVDLDIWRAPGTAAIPASLHRLERIPGPLVVFWGVIDRRPDVAMVRALARTMTAGTILLVGPRDHPDPELLGLPRVRTLASVPFADLPTLAARAAVLIAPYADLPVTRAMQPLKLKEYLATGKPAVVRKLPATEPWADCADVVETPGAFAAAVLERLRTGLPEGQRRARQRLEGESWAAKAKQFERWLDEE
jgi:glycosyltransferase involved in cell wall biosynthesis